MSTTRINLAAVLAGLLLAAAAVAFAADAYTTWELRPAVLWSSALIGWGATLVVRAVSRDR